MKLKLLQFATIVNNYNAANQGESLNV